MSLYASIPSRKSCRKYEMQPLKPEVLDEIETAIKGFEPLYPNSQLKWRITPEVKGRFLADAPHYLIVSGEGKTGEMESAGFLFEQLVLWFDEHEIGSVWLGAAKDAGAFALKTDIIVIAFGTAAEPLHRTGVEEFKRKPIEKITNAPDDVRVQAVHLAPSGMNTQPWYFEAHENGFWVYKQKLKPPISLIYQHSDIDMGIALCHYALACKELGVSFQFSRSTEMEEKSGYLPFGIIG